MASLFSLAGDGSSRETSEHTPLILKPPKTPKDQETEDDSEEDEKDALDFSTNQLAVMFSCLGSLVVLGVASGMVFEQWSFITALYVVVQLITTIGYGDFTLTTWAMKVVFCFIGCCTLVIYICLANKLRGDWHKDFLRHQLEKVEAAYVRSASLSGPVATASTKKLQDDVAKTFARYNKLIIATVPALLDITFGTLFYANYEACTCSYGVSHVPGCREDSYEVCVESGGYTKTLLSAFYMSVMTVLTVGFGDYSPRTRLGRAVGVVWMLTGVASMANWLRTLSHFIDSSLHHADRHHQHLHKIHEIEDEKERLAHIMDARNAFSEMDADMDGKLSRAEFRMFFLVRQKLVSREALKAIDKYFDELDTDRSQFVTEDEVLYAQTRRRERWSSVAAKTSPDLGRCLSPTGDDAV